MGCCRYAPHASYEPCYFEPPSPLDALDSEERARFDAWLAVQAPQPIHPENPYVQASLLRAFRHPAERRPDGSLPGDPTADQWSLWHGRVSRRRPSSVRRRA